MAQLNSGSPDAQPLSRRRWFRDRHLSILTIAVVFAAWWAVTALAHIKPILIPSPGAVWEEFIVANTRGFQGVLLIENIYASLSRLLAGWSLAVMTAVPLGLLMGASGKLEALIDPLIEFIRPLPPTGYYILLLLWFGLGDLSKVALMFLAVFPYVLINTRSGAKGVRILLLRMAASMGASGPQRFRYIVLPSAAPSILTGMRLGLGNAFATLVAAEIVAAESGLGRMILDGSRYLATDIVFLGIITVGVLAVSGDTLLRFVERRALPWLGHD